LMINLANFRSLVLTVFWGDRITGNHEWIIEVKWNSICYTNNAKLPYSSADITKCSWQVDV